MKETIKFTERRKEYRLPYNDKVIFSDGTTSSTAFALNISRGGVFVTTLEPFPIDTQVHLLFFLPGQANSFCVKGRVAHIVFDRQRCEIECGMGFMFQELTDAQRSILNLHILNQQSGYMEMKKLLQPEKPDWAEIGKMLKKLPHLDGSDLLKLRYRVNRICTLFEPVPAGVSNEGRPPASA